MPTTGVVCYIRRDGRVLLQFKTPGRFGGGWWNAPGGKLDHGETPEQAIMREVKEETSLDVTDLREHGTLMFYFGDVAEPDYLVHVFSTTHYSGEPQDSEEGHLEWFDETALPYDDMWPDDRIWLPDLLAGRSFRGVFHLTADYKSIVSYEYDLLAEPVTNE
ncbi:MAG: 8-oxo-dGTP diphosphatase [Chloroflexi bacterium]|nr:8-oxo-dGTP diphosphatase [Chloroflexota bacterium]